MEIFYVVLVILVITRLCGEVSSRLGQSVLLGELISGVLLGVVVSSTPSTFPILSDLDHNEVFHILTEFGIFFLMLMAGMELQPRDIVGAGWNAIWVALFAVLVPLGLGISIGYTWIPYSDLLPAQALFLGIVLTITAVPVLVKILIDLDLLNSKYGKIMVAAGFAVEVGAIILLIFMTNLISTHSLPGADVIFEILLNIFVYFFIIIPIGVYVYPYWGKFLLKTQAQELEFTAVIVYALFFSVLAEVFQMHFLIGAFMAGLFFQTNTVDRETFKGVMLKVEGLTFGFFAPIFFASIGLKLDLSAILNTPVFILVMILAAFASKMVSAGLISRLLGASKRNALLTGLGMTAKGSLDLIVAGIALNAGLFETNGTDNPIIEYMFSAIVIMSITTTLLIPISMKFVKMRRKI